MFTLSDQPQSIFGIIANSLRLYKSVLIKILPFSLIYVVTFTLPNFLLFHLILVRKTDKFLDYFGIAVLCFFLSTWLVMVMYYRVYLVMIGSSEGYGLAIKTAFQKFVVCLITHIIFFIITLVGMMLFLIPGIFFAIYFGFYLLAIIIDQDDVVASFRRSASLVRNHWWRTFVITLVPFLAIAIISKALEQLIDVPLVFISHVPTFEKIVHSHIIMGVIMAILLPWFLTMLLCQYHDLKLRHSDQVAIE